VDVASIMSALLNERQRGFSLPQAFYTDDDVFRNEMERVFRRRWLFAGYTCQVPNPGDYFTFELDNDSLIVIRDDQGEVRALFNTCRHRGSRICSETEGHAGELVCPYHQWVYERDGKLAAAKWMGPEFDKSQFPLHRAHVQVLAGLIYVCLADEPPDFEPARCVIEPFIVPHGLDRGKICYSQEYSLRANWKLLVENNRECYHCPGGHPEFCQANFDVGMPGDPRGSDKYQRTFERMRVAWEEQGLPVGSVNFPDGEWFRCARVPLRTGYVTESLDGQPLAPLMGDLKTRDLGSLRVINLPHAWFHFNSDNANGTQLIPVGPELTRARLTWLVNADAVEGIDYDPRRVAEFWKITTEQDFSLCENNHAGIRSSRYRPGPYSSIAEPGVEQFVEWYLRIMSEGKHCTVT
jgi:Rieske 2Fe-2S family protein